MSETIVTLRLVVEPDGIDPLILADWFEAADQNLMGYLDSCVAAAGATDPQHYPALLRVTAEVVT